MGLYDEVILPRDTRQRIARALQMLRNKTLRESLEEARHVPL